MGFFSFKKTYFIIDADSQNQKEKPLCSFSTMSANVSPLRVWSQAVEAYTFLSFYLRTPWSVEVSELSTNVTITLTHHECCTIFTAGLFPDTRWPCLAVSFLPTMLFMIIIMILFMTEPASGNGVEGCCVCLLCGIQARIVFMTQTRGWFISRSLYIFCEAVEWKVCDGAVCSLLVDQLQRDPLCSSVSVTKSPLWCWSQQGLSRICNSSSAQSVPNWGFVLVFSSQSHWGNPALEMGQLCLLNCPGRLVYFVRHAANQW